MIDTHAAPLRLRLHNDLTIVVPATLSAITTYVLLEQEEWFEKEINFLRDGAEVRCGKPESDQKKLCGSTSTSSLMLPLGLAAADSHWRI
jgi:hypothetical protein